MQQPLSAVTAPVASTKEFGGRRAAQLAHEVLVLVVHLASLAGVHAGNIALVLLSNAGLQG